MERDIRADKEINEYQLQEELRTLPSLVWYYNNEYQNAKTRAQECKTRYEYVQESTLLRLLAEKTAEEGKKPTDKILSAHVSLDKEVQDAYNEYLAAEKTKAQLYTCTQVIDCKINAIKQLVELHKIDYFNTDMSVEARSLAENKSKSEILRQKENK